VPPARGLPALPPDLPSLNETQHLPNGKRIWLLYYRHVPTFGYVDGSTAATAALTTARGVSHCGGPMTTVCVPIVKYTID
jgi:hypothetical protein